MRIMNGMSETIRVRVWRDQNRIPGQYAKEITSIASGRTVEVSILGRLSFYDLEIGILPHPDLQKYDSRLGGRLGGSTNWPFSFKSKTPGVPADDEIVVTPNYRSRLVDWTKAKKELEDGAKESGASGGNNQAVEAGLEAGSAVIAALGTGIAALGPAGAVPAGLVMGIGSLFLLLFGGPQSSGPPPLTEQQVHDIVTEVVRRELEKSEAENAATLFASATRALQRHHREAKHQIVDESGNFIGDDLTPAEKARFERFLENALSEGTAESLHHHINHIGGDPERAKWIVPAYLAGVGTYLTLVALQLMRLNHRPGPPPEVRVSDDEAAEFRAMVAFHREGLSRALEAFEAMVTKQLEEVGVQSTPKEKEARRLIRMSILGVPDLTAVKDGIAELEAIIDTLDANPGGAALSVVANR